MPRPSPALFSSKSSTKWLSRQSRDPMVRKRVEHPANFRSRSAFKLLELEEKHRFLTGPDVNSVVDLGAAPGGWSQVVASRLGWMPMREDEGGALSRRDIVDSASASEEVGDEEEVVEERQLNRRGKKWIKGKQKQEGPDAIDEFLLDSDSKLSTSYRSLAPGGPPKGRGTIIAVDLLPMQPIPGVTSLQMDFLSPDADARISSLIPPDSSTPSVLKKQRKPGKVDVILSDMAANFTGNRTRDVEASLDICEAVFAFAQRHLRDAQGRKRSSGGALVLKHFAHPLTDQFRIEKLQPNFHSVRYVKPDSSRSDSTEGYWLCFGWRPRTEDL
ncbi:unnamed protein product [Somion occarium]|uniref:rRNA methyltransferase 2, mitochondrial n=1 Tax=Somion occarium TaxID=3059160 RepID=A0ABP1D4G7_9APHY